MPRIFAGFWVCMHLASAMLTGSVDFPIDLEKWIATGPPEPGSDRWYIANGDGHEWVVTLRDGRPRVGLRDPRAEAPAPLPFEIEPGSSREGLAGTRLSIKVSDGWIVAFNAGEFGAGLWWFSPDGKKRDKIAEAWIVGFFPTEAGLLALEGLAHGAQNAGRVIRLARGSRGRWQSEEFVDLKHAPEVALKDTDGSLIVATTDRLLRVIPAKRKVERLVDKAFWGGLYPSSMVITPAGRIYLGMRFGVAEAEKKDRPYRLRWLLPNKEFVEMKFKEGFR